MGDRKYSRTFLIVIFIYAISVVYSQTQCQDCNYKNKRNNCDRVTNKLLLRNCTTFNNQVNKTVAKNITHLRLLNFESEIVLPGNLKEEFPNLETLDIYGGKSRIRNKQNKLPLANQQKWSKKLTTLKIHNIDSPFSLPNFANSNIKVLEISTCRNIRRRKLYCKL